MPTAVGVISTETGFRLVKIEGYQKKYTIVKQLDIPQIDESQDKSQEDDIFSYIQGNDEVTIGVSSSNVSIRSLNVPFVGKDVIEKTLGFEMENQVYGVGPDTHIVDFYTVSEEQDGSNIIAVAVPKEQIGSIIETYDKNGIDPSVITLDIFALLNVISTVDEFKNYNAFSVIHIYNDNAFLLFVNNGKLSAVRVFKIFNKDKQKMLTQLYEEYKRSILVLGLSDIPEIIFFANDNEDEDLTEELSRIEWDGIKLVHIDIPDSSNEENKNQFIQDKFIVPLGLALVGLEHDVCNVNFRKGKYRYEKKHEIIKKYAFISLCLAFALVFIFTIVQKRDLVELKDDYNKIEKYEENIFKKLPFIIKRNKKKSVLTQMKEIYSRYSEEIGEGENPLPVNALEYLNKVFEIFRNFDKEYVVVNKLSVSLDKKPKEIDIEIVSTLSTFGKILRELNQNNGFKAKLKSSKRMKDSNYDKIGCSIIINENE